MQYIARNIRTLRKTRGMTQEELASALHVTRQAVSSWERGGSCPDFDTLRTMAEILDVTPEQLLYGEQTGTPPKLKKVRYGNTIALSLVAGVILALTLGTVGLLLYFSVLITACTCAIIDEIRNGEYYRRYGEACQDGNESEPIEPIV